MPSTSRRTALTTLELIVGATLIALSVYVAHGMFRPIPGHVDGRGLFSTFVVPPIAGLGGGIFANVVLRSVPVGHRRIARYVGSGVFSVLALLPSLLYVFLFADENVSRSLATYDAWFVVAVVVGLVVAAGIDVLRWSTNQ